jgi:hypothetical protein
LNEPAFDQLLRRLVQAEIDFVLVGGLAVNAWGVVRGTKDVATNSFAREAAVLGVKVAV